MTATATDWFTMAFEDALTTGQHRFLESVIGPVQLITAADDLEGINWPPQHIRRGPTASVIATLATTHRPVPHTIRALLESPHARRSRLNGRGAFPLRWLPGQSWTARYDNGPYVLRHGDRILLCAMPRGTASTWMNRVLREVFIHGGHHHGFRLCHGAVIDIAGQGLLITGPSGAGKTDLALKLARQLPARVVTVDRGIIGVEGDYLAAGTLPFAMNIYRDTLTDLGCLDDDLLRRYPSSNDKHYLSTADAMRHCGITLSPQTRIHSLVELAPPAAITQWHPLDETGLALALRSSDTSGTDPGYQTDWLGLGTDDAPAPLHPGRTVVGWSLRYRPDRPLPPAWLTTIADTLISHT